MKRLKNFAAFVPVMALALSACGGAEEDGLANSEPNAPDERSAEVRVESEEQLASVEQGITVSVYSPSCGHGTYSFIDCRPPAYLERGCKSRRTGRIVSSQVWTCDSCIDWGRSVQCGGFF